MVLKCSNKHLFFRTIAIEAVKNHQAASRKLKSRPLSFDDLGQGNSGQRRARLPQGQGPWQVSRSPSG